MFVFNMSNWGGESNKTPHSGLMQFIAVISIIWLQYCMSCSAPRRTHANIKNHHAWKNITDA